MGDNPYMIGRGAIERAAVSLLAALPHEAGSKRLFAKKLIQDQT